MKKVLLLFMALMFSILTWGQTVLISPSGDGGFETGATFVDNGWTVVNGTATATQNQWYLGNSATPSLGSGNVAYITNNTGTGAYAYTNSSAMYIVHFYKDVTFPAGETSITLSFDWKGVGETTAYDGLQVSLAPTTTTPVAASAAPTGSVSTNIVTGATFVGNALYFNQATPTTATIYIPASVAGNTSSASTMRLIFTFRMDGSVGTSPGTAIDNISLTSRAMSPLTGLYTINNTLPTTTPMVHDGTGNFSSFTEAINYLNSDGISGAVTFNVTAGQTFAENTPVIMATGTVTNTITFVKSGVGANPVITPAGTAGATDAGITIAGGDYFTFDGIDINANAVTAVEYGYYVRNASTTDGAQYNVVKNCAISLNRTNTSSRAIYQNVSTAPTNATGANSYNKYQNLAVSNTYSGIFLTGNSTYNDLSSEISNCTIGAASANDIGNGTSAMNGIRITSGTDISVFNNEIRNMTITGGANLFGIYVESIKGTANNIYNNKIHDLTSTSTSTSALIYAIRTDVNASMVCNVFNNMIYGLQHAISTTTTTFVIRGISIGISGAGTGNFYYNSVRIDEDANPSSQCFYINAGTANLKNNVFANFSTGGATSKRYCIYRNGGTLTNVDNNNYYVAAGTNNFVGYFTADQATLANWQTASSKDANSKSVDPMFMGLSNLHSTSTDLNAAAVTISIANGDALDITTDIDGDLRNVTTPDMGADEFDPPTCAVPTALTSSNLNYTTATISWTAPAGTPVGYEYEVRTSGAAGSGATGLVVSGTTVDPIVTADITGLTGTTTYTYYVRTDCGASDYSPWASGTFNTLSCNVPTGVVASAITTTTATITWVAPVVGSPEGYEYEVRSSGSAGSGATGLAASGTTLSPIVTANIIGLSDATTYSIYVRTNCSVGFYSAWTTAATFTTLCNPIASLPWTENFDAVTIPAFPSCWLKENGDWITTNNASSTSDADGRSGTQFLRESWTATNEYIWTPGFTLTAGTSYDFSFWWAGDNYANWTGDIFYNSVQNSTGATQMGTSFVVSTTTTTKTYAQALRSFTPSSTGTYYFAIRVNATSAPFYLSFDDFRLEPTPSCLAPTALTSSAITSNSATISWTASASAPANGYDYYVATTTTAPDGATVPTGSVAAGVTTANLSSLSANTTYYIWVRANCNGVDYSTWVGSINFTTLPSCLVPTTLVSSVITSNSATISWTASASAPANGYDYYVATTSTPIPDGATVPTGSVAAGVTTADLSSLSASTTYYFWVRSNCNGVDYSAWTSFGTFTTSDNFLTLPISEDFESGLGVVHLVNGTQVNYWMNGPLASQTGDCMYITNNGVANAYSTGSTSTSHAYIPVDFNGITNATLSFDWISDGENSFDFLKVYLVPESTVITAGTQLSAADQIGTIYQDGTAIQTPVITLSASEISQDLMKLVFSWRNDGSGGTQPPASVDNILLEEITCMEPTTIAAGNITSTSADITWTASVLGETSWNIKVNATNTIDPTTTDGDIVTNAAVSTTPEYALSSLTAETDYYIYVQSACGSDWVEYMFTTPASCPVPTGLSSLVTGSSTATLSWDELGETAWNIKISLTQLADPGSVTADIEDAITGGPGEYLATGLTGNTTYYWYVQSDCGSDWSAEGMFTTDCGVYTPDYTEDFTTYIPDCWLEADGPVTGPTTFGTSDWLADGFANAGSTGAARINLYYNNDREWLISPEFDLSLGGYELNFDVAVTTYSGTTAITMGSDDEVQLLYTLDGTTWINLETWNAANNPSNTGDNTTVDISILTGTNVQFAFWASDGTIDDTQDYNFYLDNFIVRTQPSCIEPTALISSAITSNSATISWTASASTPANGYEYYVSTSSTPAPDGATAATGTTLAGVVSVDLTSLTESTNYYIWVRSNCDGVDFSEWTGPLNFATIASCIVPSDLAESSITSTSAILSWTENNGSTNWTIKVSTTSIDPSVDPGFYSGTITTNPLVIPDGTLTPTTTYYWYIQTDCGAGSFSDWSAEGEFTTLCAPESIYPYIEPFNTYLPTVCWTEGDNGDLATGPAIVSQTASSWTADGFINSGSTGSAKINIYYNDKNDWLISPEFELPATPSLFAFYDVAATQWGATTAPTTPWEADDFVEFLIYANGTWNILETYNSSNVPSHLGQNESFDLAAYAGQTVKFAFRAVEGSDNGSADIDFFVDNLAVRGLSDENDILTFSLTNQSLTPVVIDEFNHTVAVEVLMGTDLTNLVPTFTISDFASVDFASGVARDFSSDVEYIVTSELGTPQTWTVTTTISTTQSSDKDILTFELDEEVAPATIGANTVDITVDFMADITDLIPTITVSPLATVSPASLESVDFTNPVTYTVTAEDATTKDYLVSVTKEATPLGAGCDNPIAYTDINDPEVITSINTISREAWFTVTLDDTYYNVEFSTCPSAYDTKLYVYDACGGTQLGYDDDAPFDFCTVDNNQSLIEMSSLAAGTYYVLVSTFSATTDISDPTTGLLVTGTNCMAPTNVDTDNLTPTTTDIVWTPITSETGWNIKVSTTDIDPITTDGDIVANDAVATTPIYSLSSLIAETDYYVYIQANCVSTWVEYMFTTPAACPVPTGLTATVLGANDVTLTWDELGTSDWVIEVSTTQLTDPSTETGNILNNTAVTGAIGQYDLSGLTPNTTYYWYVMSNCGSAWSIEGEFTTECDIYTIPFVEDFTGITATQLPECWTESHTHWDVEETNNAGGTSPELVLNWSPSTTAEIKSYLPVIDATTNSNLAMTFSHFADWFSNSYDLRVDYTIDGGMTWNTAWSETSVSANIEQEEVFIDLGAFVDGETFQLAFVFDGYTWDINGWYIDNINIFEMPQIANIDINSDAVDVEVCQGTLEADAIASLATQITITDTDAAEHVVNLTWTIASYDANTPADYTATGTFTLPVGVVQTDPVTPLEVTALVTVGAPVEPTFSFATEYCLNSTADALPATSDNTYTGTWSPATIATDVAGTADYIFTPDAGQCASPVTIQVTINDLPVVTCPTDFEVTDITAVTLTGAAPAGGEYTGTGVTAGEFSADGLANGPYTITYTYTDGTTGCTNFCEFIITVNIPHPAIADIDVNNDVEDVAVCLGAVEADAIALLASQITIEDEEANQYVVDVTWSIAAFDGNTAADYTATGTFELPVTVSQTDPITPLEVSAIVTVNDLPVVTCPDNMAIASNAGVTTLTGASPAGGVYSGTNVTGDQFDPTGLALGAYTITYTYTDPTTGCVNSCDFTIDIVVSIVNTDVASIAIYPNPNNGIFTLNFSNVIGEVNYQIYDTKGSIIVDENIMTSGNTVKEVELNLVPGVYYVKLITNAQTVVEKLVIE